MQTIAKLTELTKDAQPQASLSSEQRYPEGIHSTRVPIVQVPASRACPRRGRRAEPRHERHQNGDVS